MCKKTKKRGFPGNYLVVAIFNVIFMLYAVKIFVEPNTEENINFTYLALAGMVMLIINVVFLILVVATHKCKCVEFRITSLIMGFGVMTILCIFSIFTYIRYDVYGLARTISILCASILEFMLIISVVLDLFCIQKIADKKATTTV
jgi:hypothetical protein